MAAALRAGGVSPVEVCREAIRKIEEVDPALNAVVIPLFDRAMDAAASGAEGPFAGVPILLKDIGACLKGLPLYQGNQLLRRLDWRALEDAPLARRLVEAGFNILGKTNTPEFGAGVDTQPRSFGPTHNPWDLDYSTSGSSGGSAAAVAAGLVPIAHGNDFGGSIRAPAAWCGVIGLKPSRGRVSTAPSPPGANTEFVLTRSLRDTAAVLDVVADPDDGGIGGRPSGGWLEHHARPPSRSRVGVISGVDGVETDGGATHRAMAAVEVLATAGHEVVELDAGFLADEDWEPMQLRLRANGARARLDALRQLAGRDVDDEDVEPLMIALAGLAPSFSDEELVEAGRWQLAYAQRLHDRWRDTGVDAVVTPTTGIPPQPLADLSPPADDPARIYDTYRRIGCFAGCWNLSGHPAISIPWWTPAADPLPLGVQLVTAPGDELRLLQLANELSELRPELTAVRGAPVG
jgi:amidase